ncbi:unknown [Akkermansia sp. CAG:344]|nr:unknown [Akkermansia sp. CAG:344]
MHCAHKFIQSPQPPPGTGQCHMGPMDRYIRGASSRTDQTRREPPVSSCPWLSSPSAPENGSSRQSARWKPAFSTTDAMRPLAGESGFSNRTVIRPVSKFSSTRSTPSNPSTARSTLAAQPAQCMPETR